MLVGAILVLLYGRIEIINTPEKQDETIIDQNDHSADTSAAQDKAIIDQNDHSADTSAVQDKAGDYNESLSDEQRAALRQKYIATMKVYENETKIQIEKLNLATWSPESITMLQTQEQKAIKAFAGNQFAEALTHLDELVANVAELQSQQQQNFNEALANAQQAFRTGDIATATAAIDDALRYLPEDSNALLLKERISTMGAVIELISKADIARTENNLDDEISLVEQAIKLDPQREELIERHQKLLEKQRQLKLDKLLQRTSQALNNKNIKEAQALISQIKQIDATYPSLKLFTTRITQTQKKLSYQTFVAKAEAAERNDDWQTAQNYYQQALQIFSDNAKITKRIQLATQINRYTNTIQQALAKPERLADDQIALAMKQIIADSGKIAKHSTQLQQLIGQLDSALVEMSIAVPVTVYSDEQTHISVMSVGVIGKVREYQLKAGLKPGRYRFKGERKGYKDKLVEIDIKPRQAASVRVVCDETI